MKNKIVKTISMIESTDWDQLVSETYGRPYCVQQQNGCQSRGTCYLTVPDEDFDNTMHDDIPEVVNGPMMGVKFATWLDRDPGQALRGGFKGQFPTPGDLALWWQRSFYPDLQTVANDLHNKGLLEAGEYVINIDW